MTPRIYSYLGAPPVQAATDQYLFTLFRPRGAATACAIPVDQRSGQCAASGTCRCLTVGQRERYCRTGWVPARPSPPQRQGH